MSKKIIGNEATQFKGEGKGIPHNQKPISVMFPPLIDELLRNMDNRSEYIRNAIINQLYRDRLLPPHLTEQYHHLLDPD